MFKPSARTMVVLIAAALLATASADYTITYDTNVMGTQDNAACTTEDGLTFEGGCGDGNTGDAASPDCTAQCDSHVGCIGFVTHPWGANMKSQIPMESCLVSRGGFTWHQKTTYTVGDAQPTGDEPSTPTTTTPTTSAPTTSAPTTATPTTATPTTATPTTSAPTTSAPTTSAPTTATPTTATPTTSAPTTATTPTTATPTTEPEANVDSDVASDGADDDDGLGTGFVILIVVVVVAVGVAVCGCVVHARKK